MSHFEAIGGWPALLTQLLDKRDLSAADARTKSAEDKVHCVLEARLAGSEVLVAKNHAGNAHQAIDGAVRKLHRAIDTQLGKHGPQVHRQPHHGLPGNDGDEDTAAISD